MKRITTLTLAAALSLSTAAAVANDGAAVYNKTCVACHGTGAAGSPKIGDKTAWEPRIAKGMEVLVKHAIEGIPGTAMLARGTCGACSDTELQAAVEYMVSRVQ